MVVVVGQSNERIAVIVVRHACFVADTHGPHARAIEAAAKALTTSHFHFLEVALSFESKAAVPVFIAFKWAIARHLVRAGCRRVAVLLECSGDGLLQRCC